MFDIKEYKDKFKIYELRDEKAKSYVKVCPELGGIIIGFGVDGVETLFLNKDTFYDENKNIRGGIPILFPLCGKLKNQKYSLNGHEYMMKNHGIARINSWEVVETDTDKAASIKISFKSDEKTLKSYPFEFELIFEYVLNGNKLTINQEYINKSDSKMPMAVGFHPYFYANDKKTIYYDVNADKYFDNDDLKIKKYPKEGIDLSSSEELKLLIDNKGNTMSFKLKDLNRKITFNYSNEFKYIVLWSTPGSNFICVEPWTSKLAALQTGEDLLEVESKGKLELMYSITIEQ